MSKEKPFAPARCSQPITPPAEEPLRSGAARRSQPAEAESDYCILCGAGPLRIGETVTITEDIDPYVQIMVDEDDEDVAEPVRACRPCFRVQYGPEPAGNETHHQRPEAAGCREFGA